MENGRSRVAAGRTPAWGRDGRSLFYVSADEHMMRVPFAAGTTWRASSPQRLFATTRYALGPIGRGFDVAPDGRFLVIKNLSATGRDTWELAVVQNWTEELTGGPRRDEDRSTSRAHRATDRRGDHRLLRHVAGAWPTSFLNARLNAASDS